jgi:hypothetical protein
VRTTAVRGVGLRVRRSIVVTSWLLIILCLVACDHGRTVFFQPSRLSTLQHFFQASSGPAATSETTPAVSAKRVPKLDHPELRYRVLDHFEGVFFCGPDALPVGLSPDSARRRALEKFPEIQEDQDTFRVIIHHLGINEMASLSDKQKQLIYGEFNKLRGAVYLETQTDLVRFKVRLREKAGDFEVEGLIDQHGVIEVLKRERTFFMCPMCLAGDTRIATPNGSVAVKDLKEGMLVWTIDSNNHKIAMPIIETAAVPVPPLHRMIHLALKDGRQLWASPGHPTSDGRTVSQLNKDAIYDGGVVELKESVAYGDSETYDLLPGGETGFYWANGILLASTLR